MKSHSFLIMLLALIVSNASCSGNGDDKGGQNGSTGAEEPELFSGISALELPQSAPLANESAAAADAPELTLTVVMDQAIVDTGRSLAGDPTAVREYVSREIAYESYDGVLKGAGGTYLTRSGNSADQTILVAALLRGGGHQSELRFASCNSVDLGGARSAGHRVSGESPFDYRGLVAQVSDPELGTAIRWFGDALTHARRQAKHTGSQLAATLERVLKPILDRRSTSLPVETAHIWLQLNQGGTWIDLDPATASGNPPCEPTATNASLSAQSFHRVALSVVVESLKSDALQESTVLRVEKTTADIATSGMLFVFGEPTGLVQRQGNVGDGLARYTPVFRIDGENIAGTPIVLPQIKTNDGPQGVAGGFADVLGSDFYGGVENAAIPADDVMAAWIQIEMIAPGREAIRVRSEIFNRLGMSTRVRGSDSVVLLPLEKVQGEYAALSSAWQVGFLFGEMAAPEATLATSWNIATPDGISALLDSLVRTFPAVRREIGGAPATPMIIVAGLVPANSQSGEPVTRLVLDALHINATLPRDAIAAARDAVATPFAEDILVSIIGGRSFPLDDVAGVIRSAGESSTPLLVIEAGKVPSVPGASSDALARMELRSRRGQPLVTPANAPSAAGVTKTAWWYVDPSTGIVRDEHENGRHPAVVETATKESKTPSSMERLRRFACTVATPVVVATYAIFIMTGGQVGKDAAKAVNKAGQAWVSRRKKIDEAKQIACGKPSGPPIP